jgi:hypothetical protein
MTFFYDLNKKLDEIRATPSTTHGQLNERDMGKHNNATTGFKALAKKTGGGEKGNRIAGAQLAKMRAKGQVEEGGLGDMAKKVGGALKKVGGAVLNKVGHGDDADMIRDLQRKMGVAQTGEKPKQVKEKMNPAKQKSFAALAPPTDKITFADKIAGAKKEVDEMLGDVAAEAIKGALSGKQKKLDKNNNGKLDANDFAMLRKGGKKVADESRDNDDDVYSYQDPAKAKTHKTASGGTVTRHGGVTRHQAAPGHYGGYDPETDPDKDDDKPGAGEKRGRGRPAGKGAGKSIGAKINSGKSKLMTREGDFGPMEESSELKAAMMLLKKAGYKVSKAVEEESTTKRDNHAEKAGRKVTKDIEYDEKKKDGIHGKKRGAEDSKAERAGKKVAKDIEYDEKKSKKKEKTEEAGGTGTPTASSGFGYGKGIYDSMNHELETMIRESMNISMNMSNDEHGGPNKSLTVTATDDDAMKLSDLLKNAGLGGGDHPNVEGGADLDHPGAIEVNGTMDADGAEDLANQIRQAVDGNHGHEGEETCDACGQADCGCEEMDEAAVNVSNNQPDYPTNTETAQDSFEYSGGLNGPKSTGQTTIPVIAGQEERMGEDDLSRLREMAGIKEGKKPDFLDMDKDGDKTEPMKKAVDDKKAAGDKKVAESLMAELQRYKKA